MPSIGGLHGDAEGALRHAAGLPEMIPSRKALLEHGAYPLEQRIAELAAHVYYLWGDARHLLEMSTGENANVVSHVKTLENFAANAHQHMHRMVKAMEIPVSADPPHLPVSVSSVTTSALLAWQMPLLRSNWAKHGSRSSKAPGNCFL
mmetsp:Transcript_17567/g.40654  ORF Transcript_17567/g.40654 Transcript_17567/m.40654 type:complete len:148 (-) Transcript_17567:33-476(-)